MNEQNCENPVCGEILTFEQRVVNAIRKLSKEDRVLVAHYVAGMQRKNAELQNMVCSQENKIECLIDMLVHTNNQVRATRQENEWRRNSKIHDDMFNAIVKEENDE